MRIGNLLPGYPDPTGLGRPEQPVERVSSKPLDAFSLTPGTNVKPDAAVCKVLADYDVTDISPHEFSEMIHQLRKLGAISDQQLRDLAMVRLDLDREGIDPEESIDLVDFYADKLRQLLWDFGDRDRFNGSASSAKSSVAEVRHRLEWLEKLALIQSDPNVIGLDTLT